MIFRSVAVLLSVLLAFEPSGAVLAQASEEGVISGQVVNGTEGGGSVAGVEVALITYIDDALAGTELTSTDGEGRFRFDNVDTGHTYLVSANYMKVDYYYPVDFGTGGTTVFVEVGVCDTTTSDEAVRVGLRHTIIEVGEERLLVTEVLWLSNDGDSTYVGIDGVLVFTLPDGAYDFTVPQETMQDYKVLGDNMASYLVPFPPGERQLLFTYNLERPESDELVIPLEIDYPTDTIELMVGGEGIEVSVSRLAPSEPVFTEADERFIHFRGENYASGTVIELSLSGLSGGGVPYFIAIWVIIAMVIAGTAIYLIRRNKVGKKS
ncbi:carboxypeptidase-like regulatory domain-containing protein [Chloroflexota bacterium]